MRNDTGIAHKGWPATESLQMNRGYWDDLRFPVSAVQSVSGKPPTETAYKGGLVLAFPSNTNTAITFNAQMPHGYDDNFDLGIHLHIVPPTSGAGAGAENVKFDFTYSWADIGATFPAETTLTATRDVQNDTADDHILMDLGDVLSSNRVTNGSAGVSSMLICSLERDVSVANDYASSVYLIEADFHYRFNAPGSKEEYIK